MTRMLRALLVLCSASVSIVLVKATGAQDNFPSRPIKLIVPFPAGGGIDVTARITAQALGNMLGQQVIVQNEGGAGGAIATDSVVKSEPDGYTLLYHSTTGIVHAAVTEKLPYTWLNDLAPVSIVTRFAPVMIVSPTLAVKDLREFIALLKNNPGKYSFASSGTGTAVHLAEDGSVIGVTAANNPRDIRAGQALIKSRLPVDRALLADPKVPLQQLIRR